MDYNRFVAEVILKIREYLPESYQNAQIEVTEAKKLNQEYQALIIRHPDKIAAPSLDLHNFFEMAESGLSMEQVLKEIAEYATKEPEFGDISNITDYSVAKDKLFIRVSDGKRNAEFLNGVPHLERNGLVVTCHILIEINKDEVGSTAVNNELLKGFGVTQEKLFEDAISNSPKLLPPVISPMETMLGGLLGFEDPVVRSADFEGQLEMIGRRGPDMMVLTNSNSVNGAAVIFYPEVLEKIGEKMGADYFILPSSVHEVLILPDAGNWSVRDLETMVKEVNNGEVAAKDRLSYDVFHYDSKEHLFEKARDHEARVKGEAPETQAKGHKEKSMER